MSIEQNQNCVDSENAEDNRAQTGSPVESGTAASSAKSQKKKRREQKTANLFDLFNQHESGLNWADAASEGFPSLTKSEPVETKAEDEEENKEVPTGAAPSRAHEMQGGASFQDGPASHSHYGSYDEPPWQAYVNNIPYKAREEDLFYFFGSEGAIEHIALSRGTEPGTNSGSAIITFLTPEAFERGLAFNDKCLSGRQLRVCRANRRGPRQGSYRGSHPSHDRRHNHPPDGLPPRMEGGYGGRQVRGDDAYYHQSPRQPSVRKNHSYAGVPPDFSQQLDSYEPRRQPYGGGYRQNPPQNFAPSYRGRSSYNSVPLTKSSSYDAGMHGGRGHDFDPDARSSRKGGYANDGMRPPPLMQQEPLQRKRLELKPRTVPLAETASDLPTRSSRIFGDAKPVDTSKKEREVEERLDREDRVMRKTSGPRSRKTSNDLGTSNPTTPTLPLGNVTILKPPHSIEMQNAALSIPAVVEEKSAEEDIQQPVAVVPPPEVPADEDIVSTPQEETFPQPRKGSTGHPVELLQSRKTSGQPEESPQAYKVSSAPPKESSQHRRPSGAPMLVHAQSLPPFHKTQSRESVHDGSSFSGGSKQPTMVFVNSAIKKQTSYGGRRSDRGHNRTDHGPGHHHENAAGHAPGRPQHHRADRADGGGHGEKKGRRGSGDIAHKEKHTSAENEEKAVTVKESTKKEDLPAKDSTVKTKDTTEKAKDGDGKANEGGPKGKEDNAKNKKEKSAANKEKKKAATAKALPKLNNKPVQFSTVNKFSALLETNE